MECVDSIRKSRIAVDNLGKTQGREAAGTGFQGSFPWGLRYGGGRAMGAQDRKSTEDSLHFG